MIEATITDIHDMMSSGALRSKRLVEQYLDRIKAYDRGGPKLNSVITVNPHAADRAARLDEQFKDSGFAGPLHGIPILLKDQVSTSDIVTTYGSTAFADYTPSTDATIVDRLRSAGGIVLAKTNLPDWAAGFVGYSSIQGQTKNPYALDRGPGGSSAGTGAGVAANLGTVGIGEDTGGSIRVPASCCNLFGLRVTTGLISRSGLSPLVTRQDTAGPMARTVSDLARLTNVLIGFDTGDKRTGAVGVADYTGINLNRVETAELKNARIGILREVFGEGSSPESAMVNTVVTDTLQSIAKAGAIIVDPVEVPNLSELIDRSSLHSLHPKNDIDRFLSQLENSPADSVDSLYDRGAYHDDLELFEDIAEQPDDPKADPEYWERVAAQELLRERICHTLAANNLDALAFPDVQVVPPEREAYHDGRMTRADYPVNTVISSQSSCPSLSMPAGFADGNLAVGIELLGAPYHEPRLLELAAAYEKHADPRQSPEAFPALGSHNR